VASQGTTARLNEFLLTHRFAVVWIVGTLSVVVHITSFELPGDWNYFEAFSESARSRPDQVLSFFAENPSTWIGPLTLLAMVPLTLLPTTVATWTVALLIVGALPVCLRILEQVARANGVPADRRLRLLTLTCGLLAIVCWQELSVTFVHPEDAAVAVLGCSALLLVTRRRPVLAAVLLGLAASGKPWAVGLLPLVLAVRCDRRGWAAVLVGAVLAVAPWLPFVLGAPETVTALRASSNAVMPGTLTGLLGYAEGPFPWFTRPVQFGAVFAAVLLVVRTGCWELALLAGVGARLATDPQLWSYYWATLVVGAIAADLLGRRRFPWWTVLVVLLGFEFPRLVSLSPAVMALIQCGPLLGVTAVAVGRSTVERRVRASRPSIAADAAPA
jgi:hypothetical protein